MLPFSLAHCGKRGYELTRPVQCRLGEDAPEPRIIPVSGHQRASFYGVSWAVK